MDITREGGESLLRFVDEAERETIRKATELVSGAGAFAQPYFTPAHAQAGQVIKALLNIVSCLAERVEMAESYVDTATKAVLDEFDVPALTFDKIHDAFADVARNSECPGVCPEGVPGLNFMSHPDGCTCHECKGWKPGDVEVTKVEPVDGGGRVHLKTLTDDEAYRRNHDAIFGKKP